MTPPPRPTALPWLLLSAALVLGAGLRSWGVLRGQLVWHPDEVFLVALPLRFLGGDLDPHHFHYPSAHFYLLGAIYGALYVLDLVRGEAIGLYDWIALHGLFHAERLRDAARWVSVGYGLGTVACTAALAGRVYRTPVRGDPSGAGRGPLAAAIAGLLTSANVLLVRQTPIASVDTAMAFWFTAAVLAATRLVERQGLRDYALCGLAVGLTAGTKYPGAACAGAVVAAHLLAGRGILDRRLWAAGGVSALAFVAVSPFVVLDAGTFRRDFGFQVNHVLQGNAPVSLAPLYHLGFSLRHGLGLPAWLATIGAVPLAVARGEARERVVVAALLSAYAAVSWGQLVFLRYALPLLPLQATLLAGLAVATGEWLASRRGDARVWSLALLAALAALPLYHSLAVARIEGRQDTRTQARQWMEAQIPSHGRCCNFGGWAGDVQAHSFQHLWWLLLRHEEVFGLDRLEGALPTLAARVAPVPYYDYAVGGERATAAGGDWGVVADAECAYIVLHRHPLPASHVDPSFEAELGRRGQLLARFSPGAGFEAATFDPMDAFYVPFDGLGLVDRPGPEVEVWRLPGEPPGGRAPADVRQLLARAHALLAVHASRQGQTGLAVQALGRAARYGATDPGSVEAWARVSEDLGRFEEALRAFGHLQELEPGHTFGLRGTARVLAAAGRLDEAVAASAAAVDLRPRDPFARQALARVLHRAGRTEEAISAWGIAVDLDSAQAASHFNLATARFLAGQIDAAVASYDRAVRLAPDSARYWLDAGVARQRLGDRPGAIRAWRRAVGLDSTLITAHQYLAHALEAAGGSP